MSLFDIATLLEVTRRICTARTEAAKQPQGDREYLDVSLNTLSVQMMVVKAGAVETKI